MGGKNVSFFTFSEIQKIATKETTLGILKSCKLLAYYLDLG